MSIGPKELRLGNWLYGNDPLGMDYGKQGYFRVDAIEEDGINPWRMHEMDTEWASGEPVPITAAILEGAGFEKCSCGGWKNKIHIEKDLSFKHFFGEEKRQIKFVHQLQNLFYCLTGEELPITL